MTPTTLTTRLRAWWASTAPAVPAQPTLRVPESALMNARTQPAGEDAAAIPPQYQIRKPTYAPGVLAPSYAQDETYMATDAACTAAVNYAANQGCEMLGFPGYPYLAQLQQLSEYRSPSETTAMEMTRRWIKLTSHGDGDKADKIERLERVMREFGVRAAFRRCAELDGFFGHGQLFVRIKGQDTDEKLARPLVVSSATIKQGDLLGLQVIEPMWTAPYDYDAIDPTSPYFYKPRSWYVMGKRIHADRLLSFISRPVPDILKPAYNFSGMSMSQLMEPAVQAWLRNKNSVADMIDMFSFAGIKTNLAASLQAGGQDLFRRMDFFTAVRKNRGLLVLDKATEEAFVHSVPLSGLSELQAQAQEHMAAPSHTPLVKMFGITPSGLNASSEGELDVYDDYIQAMQENLFRENLTKVLRILQLHEFGEIDDGIDFEFVPLKQLSGTELAEIRKSDADAAIAYFTAGVISAEEVRTKLAADPDSGYNNIDIGAVPQPPDDPDERPADGIED